MAGQITKKTAIMKKCLIACLSAVALGSIIGCSSTPATTTTTTSEQTVIPGPTTTSTTTTQKN